MIGYAFSSHDAKFIAHDLHVVCILNRPHFGGVALLERKRVHHPDSPKFLQQDGPKGPASIETRMLTQNMSGSEKLNCL